jgi:putative hemolysin
MRALIAIFVVALAACSTPSDVVKTGDNAYRVRPNPGGATPTDAEIKARGIARANEYCEAQGQRAVITVGQSTGWHLFSMPTPEVQFFCDDRAAARPVAKGSSAP